MATDLAGLAALGGVLVAGASTGAAYLNGKRTAKASTVTATTSGAAEAQRLALEGLRELIEQQQEELDRKAADATALRSRCADQAEALGALQLRHQEALAQLDHMASEVAELRRQLEELHRG